MIVTNTGSVEGEEVVQMYIGDPAASISRPLKELKGFQKASLQPGESKEVSFTIDTGCLSFYGSDYKYHWEPGVFNLFIGTNSRDNKQTTFTWK